METEGLAWSYRIAFGNYRKNWKEKKQRDINLRENLRVSIYIESHTALLLELKLLVCETLF